jgi:hypothetical protein
MHVVFLTGMKHAVLFYPASFKSFFPLFFDLSFVFLTFVSLFINHQHLLCYVVVRLVTQDVLAVRRKSFLFVVGVGLKEVAKQLNALWLVLCSHVQVRKGCFCCFSRCDGVFSKDDTIGVTTAPAPTCIALPCIDIAPGPGCVSVEQ